MAYTKVNHRYRGQKRFKTGDLIQYKLQWTSIWELITSANLSTCETYCIQTSSTNSGHLYSYGTLTQYNDCVDTVIPNKLLQILYSEQD